MSMLRRIFYDGGAVFPGVALVAQRAIERLIANQAARKTQRAIVECVVAWTSQFPPKV